MRYLKNYWATKAAQIQGVKIHTSLKDKYACGICGVTIDGMTPAALDGALYTNYKIHTVGIVWENISCVRITPHVYTRLVSLRATRHMMRRWIRETKVLHQYATRCRLTKCVDTNDSTL